MILSAKDVVIAAIENKGISDNGCSGIRITHKQTGVFSECNEFRHQYQNKDKAIKLLKLKLKYHYE
jgi:protein subunit release factor A